MRVAVTIDLEHDCPPFLSSYAGMEDGLGRFLGILADARIPCTCFATGDVARRFPLVMEDIVRRGHELASHGDTHRRFGTMSYAEAKSEILRADQVLSRYASITSFRAPNLDFPNEFLPLLSERGYAVDSSIGAYKPHKRHPRRPLRIGPVARIPASTMPSLVRLPGPLQRLALAPLRDASVLFFHPWEFVDMTRAPIPWDCRAGTGAHAVLSLKKALEYLASRNARFLTIRDLAGELFP